MPDGTTGYTIGWFTLSLINAGLAQGKQRSGLAWWLASLLIGPFATLLIVLLPAPAESAEPHEVARPVVVALAVALVVLVALFVAAGLNAR